MAEVGQTDPQIEQLVAQAASRGTSAGLNSPSNPALNHIGWRVFVAQAFMQSPHLTQSRRNSGSGIAPGGRIRSAGVTALSWPVNLGWFQPVFTKAAVPNPDSADNSMPLLVRSVVGHVDASVLLSGLKDIAVSGQMVWHLRQTRHSLCTVSCGFSLIAVVGQFLTHLPQLVHEEFTVRLRTGRFENNAIIAPAGHK